MVPKYRRVTALAILFFILHFVATVYSASRLSTALDVDGPVAGRFVPSFAVALSVLPLYPILDGRLPFTVVTLLNSVLCAVVLALALVLLRWRTLLAMAIAIALLFFGGAMGAAMWMEHRLEAGWRELAPHAIDPVPRDAPLSSTLGDRAVEPLSAYLAREIARGDDRVDPPPQEVEYFLVLHRWDIEALRQRLISGRPPVPVENPSTYFRMQKILLVDALQTRSWQGVDAARRLTEAMLHEPTFDSVLYAIAANENQLGVARKLDPPAAAPLPSFDPHQRLIDAIAAQSGEIRKISGPWYARPYIRLCVAESAYSALRQAMLIRDLRGCRLDAPADSESKPRVPFNPTGALEGGARYAIRANRLLLDREGTESVLAMKGGGQPVATSRCRDRKWRIDGDILRLEPSLPATPPALPTRHEISARPASRSTS